ncbi:hypothetical protein BTUL_0190g00090 [Botrytis tulipae]|uniref:Uncharacterized protein n=1 Tax=Botrytis tulipae TaxID=87230 RepID=A0A4Z1E9I8_9HELO|nr:hypothetical protein BTUL_0190g00090 [Botrytis tulipae]
MDLDSVDALNAFVQDGRIAFIKIPVFWMKRANPTPKFRSTAPALQLNDRHKDERAEPTL